MKHLGIAAMLALGGCYTGSSPSPTLANETAKPQPGRLAISTRGLGPITDQTSATETALRGALGNAFPRLRVKAHDLGGGSGLVFEVFDGPEQLFYVVPDDATERDEDADIDRHYAKTIFAVFAISPKIAVEDRPWTIGAPLSNASGASYCECWGDGEVTACFDKGAPLRVIFEDRCEEAREQGGTAMIGKTVARVMWKVESDDAIETDDEPEQVP